MRRVSTKINNNRILLIKKIWGSDSHGHPPDPEEVEKKTILSQIKEDAVAHPETPPESCLQRLQSVLIYSDGLIAG